MTIRPLSTVNGVRRTAVVAYRLAGKAEQRRCFPASASVSTSVNESSRPIRWGILSAGKISSDFVQAIESAEGAVTTAVAARSKDRADAFAHDHDIPHSFGSYEELLETDDVVDVVYIGSVADQHASLATMALKAGKPTVVEKPLSLTVDETRQLMALATDKGESGKPIFLMEGVWTRCFPAMRQVREWIAAGKIGTPVVVQGDFGWSTADCGPNDRIWSPESGGMILDIGMYMAHLGQVAFPKEDVRHIQAIGNRKNGVDHTVAANLHYDEGGMLQFYVTGEGNTEERVVIQGTKGRIVMESPAHVPETIRLIPDTGRGASDDETTLHFPLPNEPEGSTWNYPGSIGFVHQVEAVGDALKRGESEVSHYTLEDSLQVASILEEILKQVHAYCDDAEEASAAARAATSNAHEEEDDHDDRVSA